MFGLDTLGFGRAQPRNSTITEGYKRGCARSIRQRRRATRLDKGVHRQGGIFERYGSGSKNDTSFSCAVCSPALGVSQERNGSSAEAFHTYSSILPYLSYLPSLTSVAPQFRLWTERLLTRLCLLWSGPSASRDPTSMDDGLRIFRVWDRLWEGRATAADTEQGSRTARRLVWRAYYDLLSSVVQRDLSTTSSVEASEKRALATLEPSQYGNTPASRLQLRAELNRVEVTYESLLLQETHFPKASERNEEIESWVEAVISNWRVLCGPGWRDEELGEGGKEAVARGVLDVSYKTEV